MIKLAATVPVTEAEGPGKRFAIWVQGCPLRCPGCCNPQYLPVESDEAIDISPGELVSRILPYRDEVEGITLIGGEPFSQAGPLATVAQLAQENGLSVMIFSGFTMEELQQEAHPDFTLRRKLLAETDLLVDGPYLAKQHVTDRRWIGSSNQRVHFLTERYRHLKEAWPTESNTLEIRLKNGKLTINGFPHRDITKRSAQLPLQPSQARSDRDHRSP